MRVRSVAATSCLAVALAFGVAACGSSNKKSSGSGSGSTGSTSLTIYSSLPLQGDSRPQSADIVRAMDMALADSGGTAGGFAIDHVSLDDASKKLGFWDPVMEGRDDHAADLRTRRPARAWLT